jgi:hypothetical protein
LVFFCIASFSSVKKNLAFRVGIVRKFYFDTKKGTSEQEVIELRAISVNATRGIPQRVPTARDFSWTVLPAHSDIRNGGIAKGETK